MPEPTQDEQVDEAVDGELRWLSPSEKEAWTGAASLMLLLPGRLDAAVQRAAGLSLFEYLTLSHMSEAEGRCLVMSELAYLTNGSLPRLSNVIKRFETRGWAYRYPDPDDRRCTIAALTDEGYAKVLEAAPAHLRSVREHVIDPLTPTDQRALARIAAKLRTRPEDFPAA